MRSGIHPEYHEIDIETTSGAVYKTRSTWGKAGEKMKLEIDPDTHPAWTGGIQKVLEGGQVARFGRRFQGKSFSASKAAGPAAQPASKPANKPASKPVAKPAVKAADKPAVQAAAKPAVQADVKQEEKKD